MARRVGAALAELRWVDFAGADFVGVGLETAANRVGFGAAASRVGLGAVGLRARAVATFGAAVAGGGHGRADWAAASSA